MTPSLNWSLGCLHWTNQESLCGIISLKIAVVDFGCPFGRVFTQTDAKRQHKSESSAACTLCLDIYSAHSIDAAWYSQGDHSEASDDFEFNEVIRANLRKSPDGFLHTVIRYLPLVLFFRLVIFPACLSAFLYLDRWDSHHQLGRDRASCCFFTSSSPALLMSISGVDFPFVISAAD